MKIRKESLLKSKSRARKDFADYISITEPEIRKKIKTLDKEFSNLRSMVVNFDSSYDDTDETQSINLRDQIIKIQDLRDELYTTLITARKTTKKNKATLTEDDYYITYADNFLNYASHRYNMYVQMHSRYEYYMIAALATINKINYRKENNISNTSK